MLERTVLTGSVLASRYSKDMVLDSALGAPNLPAWFDSQSGPNMDAGILKRVLQQSKSQHLQKPYRD